MNAFSALAFGLLASAALAQPCTPHWTTDFTMGGPNGEVSCMLPFSAGGGEMLYIGGRFQHAADVPAGGLAMWDGERFRAVPGWNGGYVNSLTILPDAAGPSLVASTSSIWTFRDGQWSHLAGTNANAYFYTAGVHDDGNGPRIYAAGRVGGGWPTPPMKVARWTGSDWEYLSGAFSAVNGLGSLDCLSSIDLGNGPALYVGGAFSHIDGEPIGGMARWDGAAWRAVGGGITTGWITGVPSVRSIVRTDFGEGPELYASGGFDRAGGLVVPGIARFDGLSWSAVGITPGSGSGDLLPIQTPQGPRLYVSGSFNFPGLGDNQRVAVWDGQSWAPVGVGDNVQNSHLLVHALAWHRHGEEARLIAAGKFRQIGGVSADNIASFDGEDWNALKTGRGLSGWANVVKVFDDGHGPAVFTGGMFAHAGGAPARSLARWDGEQWTPVDERFSASEVTAMEVFDDGRGDALYIAGTLNGEIPGFPPGPGIARWDGLSWEYLPMPDWAQSLRTLAAADEGSGPALFAGGEFPGRIAKWNGTQWAQLGGGIPTGEVRSIATFRENGAPVLFVGGSFSSADGVAVSNLARWNGSVWAHPGFDADRPVLSMVVGPGKGGEALYVAGQFARQWPESPSSVVSWDGQSWEWIGDDLGSQFIADLHFFNDGTGPALHAAGDFTRWSAWPLLFNVARLHNGKWAPMADGISAHDSEGGVNSITTFTDAIGDSLIAVGAFSLAGWESAGNIARWRACPPCYANCDGSIVAPTLNVADFTCFLNRFGSGDEWANCDGSTAAPVLNVLDFTCYMGRFAAGCP